MKAGHELIAQERKEHFAKNEYTLESDKKHNSKGQLAKAAASLAYLHVNDHSPTSRTYPPDGWELKLWEKMCNKDYKDRLIIAGALIAAEIDRIQNI